MLLSWINQRLDICLDLGCSAAEEITESSKTKCDSDSTPYNNCDNVSSVH